MLILDELLLKPVLIADHRFLKTPLLQAFCLEPFCSKLSVPSRKLTGSGLKTGCKIATSYSRSAG